MEADRFEALLRTVAATPSRRGALRALAAAVLGVALPALGETDHLANAAARPGQHRQVSGTRQRDHQPVHAAKKRKKKKKKNPQAPASPPSPPNSPPAIPCVTVNDCPGTDTECQSRVCANGTCSMNVVASGTVLPTQTAHDCHTWVCDGAGGAINQIDDGDHYGFGVCFQSYCTQGVLTYSPAPQGIPCIINGQGGNCYDGQCIPR